MKKYFLFMIAVVLILISSPLAADLNYKLADVRMMVRMSSDVLDKVRFPDTLLNEKINLQCLEMAAIGDVIEKNFIYCHTVFPTYSIVKDNLFTGNFSNYTFYKVNSITIKRATASGGDTTTLKYVPIDQLYKEPTYTSQAGIADQYSSYGDFIHFNGRVQQYDTLFGSANYLPGWMGFDTCVISVPPMYISNLVDGVTEACIKAILPEGVGNNLQANNVPTNQVPGQNITIEEYLENKIKGRPIDDK